MDPNACLEELLRLAESTLNDYEGEGSDVPRADVARTAELIEALNEWIKGGGFLPTAWTAPRVEAPAKVVHAVLWVDTTCAKYRGHVLKFDGTLWQVFETEGARVPFYEDESYEECVEVINRTADGYEARS